MKTVTKNVYYCDYCGKRSLAGWVIKRHEITCTANPNRECHLCGVKDPEILQNNIENYKSRFKLFEKPAPYNDGIINDTVIEVEWIGKPVTVQEIQNDMDGCPNCILAVLRQSGMNRYYFGFEYDYKKEFNEWITNKNNEQLKQDYYADCY